MATVGILIVGGAPGDQRRRRGRRARRLHRRAQRLLRPDRPALAGLHDLPVGHGGARQDLRAARRAARPHRPPRRASSSTRIRGEIRFDDVSFALPHRGRHASSRSTTSTCMVPPGQTVALVGATGAGKSTFAKLVARFYDPTDGRVLVDGHDLRDVDGALAALADGHRAAGGVPVQRHDRATTSRFGRPDATRTRSRPPRARSARRTSSPRCPQGLDTEVGERGVQLSAGQRQLVAFARALIADPRILVLDEATSNVDLHTEGRIEAGPAAAARRAHRDRHRPPPVDDPPGRPDRRPRPRPDRRAGHARRAHRGRAAPTRRCTRTGRSRRRRERVRVPRPATPATPSGSSPCTVEGFETYRAFAPEGWTPPSAADERERLAGLLGEDHVWYLVAEHDGALVGHVGFLPAERTFAPVRRPGPRALPPAVRRARPLGHRPGHPAARRGPRRGAHPRLHRHAPVHPGRPGARAALLRARGLGAGASAGVRRAHRPRDRGVPPRALSAYSSRPRRIASATAAARSLTPSFS